MGSLASGSEFRPSQVAEQLNMERVQAPGPGAQMQSLMLSGQIEQFPLKRLAQSIIDKEPSEIRRLMRGEPELVHGWINLLKAEQLAATSDTEFWGCALDHIRRSTLSPLKFFD